MIRDMLNRVVAYAAISLALRRRPPLDRAVSLLDSNFIVTKARNLNSNKEILVQEITRCKIVGKEWEGSSYSKDVTLRLDELRNYQIFFMEIFRGLQVTYDSPIEFLCHFLSMRTWRNWLLRELRQRRFNKIVSFQHDRMEVLRKVTNHTYFLMGDRRQTIEPDVSLTAVMELLYSNMIFSHPSYFQESSRLSFILDSLCESDDLRRVADAYRLAPKAIATLTEHDLSERRHVDNLKQNRRLFWLTVVLALSAVADFAEKLYHDLFQS